MKYVVSLLSVMGSTWSTYQTNVYVQKFSLLASDQFGAKRKSSKPTKSIEGAKLIGNGIISFFQLSGAVRTVSYSCAKQFKFDAI